MLNLTLSQNRNFVKCGERDVLIVSLDISPDESAQPIKKGNHVALLIDCSGSMNGAKIENAKNAAIDLAHSLSADDLISVVAFQYDTHVVLNPVPASNSEIEDAIRSISTAGGTDMHAGLSAGLKLLQGISVSGIRRMVLFSDGEPTLGLVNDDDFHHLATKIREEGITLDVFGIGEDYKERLLKMLAEAGGGNWEHVQDSTELTQMVHTQIEEMQNTMIANPQLGIELIEGAELISVQITKPTIHEIGPESRQVDGNTTYIGLKDIIKDKNQIVSMKVSIPPITGNEVSFLTAVITQGGSEITHQTAIISCTDDPDLYNMENDSSPRMIFEGAEVTEMLADALADGDEHKTELAKTRLRDLEGDKEATMMMNSDAEATLIHARAVSGDVKPGMSDSEKKQALHNITTMLPHSDGDAKTCPHCHSSVPKTSKFCGDCGKSINEE